MSKYLLCRPESGINDMLCQIGLCVRYCLKFDRILVIDTANTIVFSEPFDRYFTLHHPRLKYEPDPKAFLEMAAARQLTLFPSTAKLRHGGGWSLSGIQDVRHWDVLQFDLDKNYEEDVLVHHKSGGGRPLPELLCALRLSADFAHTVAARWHSMRKPYIGVHIRNTDYKSDPAVVAPILARYRGPVYLATDSAEAQRQVWAMGHKEVRTSPIPDFGGAPIHRAQVSREEKSRLNHLALEDLIMLALAETVHASNPRSGFSDLAKNLNRNQHMVIRWFRWKHVGVGPALKLRLNWLRNSLLRALRH
ncbi:MAG TPA: hypothetical protein VK985_08775 [Rariglobus sp.]|nr:hypothetical protein [Rariglobus sp.]